MAYQAEQLVAVHKWTSTAVRSAGQTCATSETISWAGSAPLALEVHLTVGYYGTQQCGTAIPKYNRAGHNPVPDVAKKLNRYFPEYQFMFEYDQMCSHLYVKYKLYKGW